MEFKLENFAGPLDLLLMLISKNKVDILDIPIAQILQQYLEIIENNFDAAETSEFIEMASRLVFIKSKLLLPKHEEEDPREELANMLLEYAKFKQVSTFFVYGQDIFTNNPETIEIDSEISHNINELKKAIEDVFKQQLPPPKVELFESIASDEIMPMSFKIDYIISQIIKNKKLYISNIFKNCSAKTEIIATFLALLELLKTQKIMINGDEIIAYEN